MTKNNITALKKEELDNVQGGLIGCLIASALAGTGLLILNAIEKFQKDKK